MKIVRRFNAGSEPNETSPEGTAELSAVPSGLVGFASHPALKRRAIFIRSLRDEKTSAHAVAMNGLIALPISPATSPPPSHA